MKHPMIDRYCIVRTRSAGVFAGTIISIDGNGYGNGNGYG